MTLDSIIYLIQTKWKQSSGEDMSSDDVLQYLRSAVIHVETIDYNSGVEYDISSNSLVFVTEPSDAVSMLYVYRSLSDIQASSINKKVENDSIGISWRSGMDSFSTSGAAKMASNMLSKFEEDYANALTRLRMSGLGMTNIPLY